MIVHGSAVARDGAGLLILGASGRGKSALALALLALGADLVADDRVMLEDAPQQGGLRMRAPDHIAGLIEARGVGLLQMPAVPAALQLVVDLDRSDSARLPPLTTISFMNRPIPLVTGPIKPHLAPVLFLLLGDGQLADPDQAPMPEPE